jgi:hypothetical protein
MIPLDRNGGIQHFPEAEWIGLPEPRKPEWVEAKPFKATLSFIRFERGRSAAYSIWRDNDAGNLGVAVAGKGYGHLQGRTYVIFLKDLGDIVVNHDIDSGTITGEFMPVKRGMNYGIKMIGDGSIPG